MSARHLVLLLAWVGTAASHAELRALDDAGLAEVAGQGGIYLSGDISINEHGGPLRNAKWGDCTESGKRCGARITVQTNKDGGWWVIDDLRGKFSFQGLTLRSRYIDSGFGGDGENFDRDVIEVGLPDKVTLTDVHFSLGTSNAARPTDSGFKQTNLFQVQMQGDINLQGNLLIFPTGNP